MTRGDSRRGRKARQFGRWAEILCVISLTLRLYRVLARGHITGRGTGRGEIDIVAKRGALIAFIEVKARPTLDQAAEALSTAQRRRLTRAALAFMAPRPELAGAAMRFDAMLVTPWRWPVHLIDAWRGDG